MYRRGSSKRRREYIDPSIFQDFTSFLEALYSLYYMSDPLIENPENIMRREFAFQFFNMDSYVRHISFDSRDELLEYLAEKHPRHAYYSIAEYELPEAKNMDEKNWLGSDLLFDLDLDHLASCGEKQVSGDKGEILDDSCFYEGYRLMLRLKTMIKRDLSPDSILIYFTGHRGFHMRVYCEACRSLGRSARRELALYFAGKEIDIHMLFPQSQVVRSRRRKRRLKPALPTVADPGWRGWVAQYIYSSEGASSLVDLYGEAWEYEILKIIEEISVPVDIMVTQDPSRLTRILGSLNGKGHLLVYDVTDSFKMDRKTLSPFKGWLRVEYNYRIEDISFLGEDISGEKGEVKEFAAPIALALAEKGLAKIIGGEVYV